MNNDDRFEFGHDNRVLMLKKLLERHIQDTHNPHQVNFTDLEDSREIDEKIEQSVYSIEAKETEDGQFCLYLYDYNGALIGEPIPIAAGMISYFRDLMGKPTDNYELSKYLYKIDLDSSGIGFVEIPEFVEGVYKFKDDYNVDNYFVDKMFVPGGSDGRIIYEDENITINTYSDYKINGVRYDKCIEVLTTDNDYYYFDHSGNEEDDPEWYVLNGLEYYESDAPTSFNLDPSKIKQDADEVLCEIIEKEEITNG